MREHYRIISSYEFNQLVDLVDQAMRNGWIPAGGVAVFEESYVEGCERSRFVFLQAMTSKEAVETCEQFNARMEPKRAVVEALSKLT